MPPLIDVIVKSPAAAPPRRTIPMRLLRPSKYKSLFVLAEAKTVVLLYSVVAKSCLISNLPVLTFTIPAVPVPVAVPAAKVTSPPF